MIYETLIVGIVIALIYSEWAKINPGGLIVPAYMALYVDKPLRIIVTVVIALIALQLYKLLAKRVILFGRRRFVILLLLGVVLSLAWGAIWPMMFDPAAGLRSIGFIIPGLLASNLEKQKWLPTLAGMATVAVLTFFCVRLIAHFF